MLEDQPACPGSNTVPCWIVSVTSAEPRAVVISMVSEELAAMNQTRSQRRDSAIVFPVLLEPQISPWPCGVAHASAIEGRRCLPPSVQKETGKHCVDSAAGTLVSL